MKDVSFVIPVKVDSPERSRNLDLVIAHILSHFDSPVFVMEADGQQHYFPKMEDKRLQYRFVEDIHQGFYHTKTLNRLYGLVDTPIMAIWDTDIIVAPQQVVETANRIRQGEAVLGLPFDGSAYHLTQKITDSYQRTMKMSTLEKQKSHAGLMNGRLTVGCAILVDRVKYLKAGGDNEYFTDWGPEDLERVKRMEIIYGKPVYRYPGYLFHLWHPRNNSRYNDPQKELLFKREYLKICGMTQKELKKYVAGWTENRHSQTIYLPF